MQNERIHLERIKKLILRVKESVHADKLPLPARYIYNADAPIPYEATKEAKWQSIEIGETWGKAWGSAWFMISGNVPANLRGKTLGLWFDCDGEACVFKNGSPWQGLTPKVDWYHNAAKYFVPICDKAVSGDKFAFLIEAAANDLFGSGKDDYLLRECALVSFSEEIYQLLMDMEVLQDLAISLPTGSTRRAKIIYGLNRICNVYNTENGIKAAKDICKELLAKPANASALTAFSVGHAHLDLAWLWRIRESKRKGGRTFANALRLLEKYPDYVFGASQAQLYKWMKELYPVLYEEVKTAVKTGRWEIQGAHWVEFDTNLISGESIIRQFLYGQRFFAEEFGIVPNCLWLPDCFGFSGNLPQFMKGCKVDYFITQKLSWNESNTFPHHLFIWQGIDGSEVKAHQLPTNDYNFSNNPSSFIKTEERFAQAELAEGYLNLYGIGDGGGGPTRNHIEYGIRQQNLEGVSKFRFSAAADFLDYYATVDPATLPKAYGELYLEFHRGTYTSQAKTKQLNVTNLNYLNAAEGLSALMAEGYPAELRKIWEDVLLLQFHDILPGSSIASVYEDAMEIYTMAGQTLHSFIESRMQHFCSDTPTSKPLYLIFNPCGAVSHKWLNLPAELANQSPYLDGIPLEDTYLDDDGFHLFISIPAWSLSLLSFSDTPAKLGKRKKLTQPYILQNELIRVKVSPQGSIESIIELSTGEEYLAGESNLLQLWEDEPNNWAAWDINHFYRETSPFQSCSVTYIDSANYANRHAYIIQDIRIGNSKLRQRIELEPGQRYVRINHDIDWNEQHKMLRVRFQPDIHSSHATCGIQMGSIKRSTSPQNAWEAAKFEFPAQGYVDLSDAKRGFSIVTNDKFGFSINENTMEMTLLRSPDNPDPQADIGKHNYEYKLFCHNNSYEQSGLPQLSESLNTVMMVTRAYSNYTNPIGSVVCTEFNHLIIKTLKPAEDGNGIIVRMYEPLGVHCEDILHSRIPFTRMFKCNMLEKVEAELDTTSPVMARPFEIITLRLQK